MQSFFRTELKEYGLPISAAATTNTKKRCIWIKRRDDGSYTVVDPRLEKCTDGTHHLVTFNEAAKYVVIKVQKDTWDMVDAASSCETEEVKLLDLLNGIVIEMPPGQNYQNLFKAEGVKNNKTGSQLLIALSRSNSKKRKSKSSSGKSRDTYLRLTGYDYLQFVLSLKKDKTISTELKNARETPGKKVAVCLKKQTPTISIEELRENFDAFIKNRSGAAQSNSQCRAAATSSSSCSGGGGGGGGNANPPDMARSPSQSIPHHAASHDDDANPRRRARIDEQTHHRDDSAASTSAQEPAVAAVGAAPAAHDSGIAHAVSTVAPQAGSAPGAAPQARQHPVTVLAVPATELDTSKTPVVAQPVPYGPMHLVNTHAAGYRPTSSAGTLPSTAPQSGTNNPLVQSMPMPPLAPELTLLQHQLTIHYMAVAELAGGQPGHNLQYPPGNFNLQQPTLWAGQQRVNNTHPTQEHGSSNGRQNP